MEYSVKEVESAVYEATIIISNDEIQPEIEKALKELRKDVSMPGFRKGKIPLDLIRARYTKNVEPEVYENLINENFKEIIKSGKYNIISGGIIKSMDRKAGGPLEAVIEFQVVPKIELVKIDNLQVTKEIREVTDRDVEVTLEDMRKRYAVIKQVEDGARDGHIISADLQELDKSGVPIVGKKITDRQFLLGSGNFGEKFESQLTGVKAGDVRSVEVVYQNQPGQPEVTEYYQVEVKKVEEEILPELDDEFAKSVGEYESMEQLEGSVHEHLVNSLEKQSQDKLNQDLIDELIKNNEFDLPPLMIDDYLDSWIESIKKQAKEPINETELRQSNRPLAIRNLKWLLLKNKFVEQENLSVGEEELEASFANIAEAANVDIEEIRKYYRNKNNRDKLKDQLEEEKIFARLMESAEINEVKIQSQPENIIQTV